MKQALADLLDLMDLETIDTNIFRGLSPDEGWQRVYGGQVLGQALVAASRTVEDETRTAHSLHGYFLRPGDTTLPILYDVDRIRDGKSFTTRRVVATQKGRAIFNMSVSFHVPESGLEHQFDMPRIPGPEKCTDQQELNEQSEDEIPDELKLMIERPRPLEMRYAEPINQFKPDKMEPFQHTWIRTVDTMPDDVRLNQCVLAYASDMTLIDTAIRPHGIGWADQSLQIASLDHAMWFHKPIRTDNWLLYAQDSPFSGGARGLCRGTFYDADGNLVASVAQEGLMRRRG